MSGPSLSGYWACACGKIHSEEAAVLDRHIKEYTGGQFKSFMSRSQAEDELVRRVGVHAPKFSGNKASNGAHICDVCKVDKSESLWKKMHPKPKRDRFESFSIGRHIV